MSEIKAPNELPTPKIVEIPETARTLPSGEREFMLDVSTSDLEINMGPQHPATHGVMRIFIRTDGEVVTGGQVHLGYLHRCAEKIGENVEWLQYLPYTDRYDYLSAMNNNLGYSLAVEAVMGVEIPRRATILRTLCAVRKTHQCGSLSILSTIKQLMPA